MRFFVLSLFFFAAADARAQTLAAVCSHLVGSKTTDCMAAGNGRYVSPEALAECDHLVGGQVVSCVGAIAGKDYAPDEAAACGQLVGGKVVDCFSRTGRPHVVAPPPPSPPPDRAHDRGHERERRDLTDADIRAELAAAIELLHANDVPAAEARLKRLLHDLR